MIGEWQHSFDLDRLASLRRAAGEQARTYGLHGQALDEFVLAVNEIMSNAIVHGGGFGKLRMWCDGEQLRCEISDDGPGIAPGCLCEQCPPLSASGGRGLWMARQFCDLDIRPGPRGTTVALSTPVPRMSALAEDHPRKQ